MSDNLRTLGGRGGGPAILILKSVIGIAGNPETTLCGWNFALFCSVFACLEDDESIDQHRCGSFTLSTVYTGNLILATFMNFARLSVTMFIVLKLPCVPDLFREVSEKVVFSYCFLCSSNMLKFLVTGNV